MRCCLLCLSLLLGLSTGSFVRAEDPLVGKRVVVIRNNAPLEVDGKEVAKAADCSVFTVKSVQGSFLWIESEKAYLRRADIVPFEDAIDYYTRQLETNQTAQNYCNRAYIWRLKGELDIALGDMNDAIRLDPKESSSFIGRGVIWDDKKEYDKAIADLSEAIRLDEKSPTAYHNRGSAWIEKKEYGKAIADFDAALLLMDGNEQAAVMYRPEVIGNDSTASTNLRAMTHFNRGIAWRRQNDFAKALADYDEAIGLDARFRAAYNNRRSVWSAQKAWDKIIADCSISIADNPQDSYALHWRGYAYEANDDFAKASADYELAIRGDAPTAFVYNKLSWLRATCPDSELRDGPKAVEYGKKACELTGWKDGGKLDTLAAAYAEAGDFDKAVEWQQKGMELAPAEEKAAFESRLKLYQDKKPYRQPAPQ